MLPVANSLNLDAFTFNDTRYTMAYSISSDLCSMYFSVCSLFRHSESYLPDFILHGTSEPANDAFLDKLADDLSNMVKVKIEESSMNVYFCM